MHRSPLYNSTFTYSMHLRNLGTSHNLLSLLIANQFTVDHHSQLENDERGRFARSRRANESHDLELQAQIAERTIAI
jgi:hypothetical protein